MSKKEAVDFLRNVPVQYIGIFDRPSLINIHGVADFESTERAFHVAVERLDRASDEYQLWHNAVSVYNSAVHSFKIIQRQIMAEVPTKYQHLTQTELKAEAISGMFSMLPADKLWAGIANLEIEKLIWLKVERGYRCEDEDTQRMINSWIQNERKGKVTLLRLFNLNIGLHQRAVTNYERTMEYLSTLVRE